MQGLWQDMAQYLAGRLTMKMKCKRCGKEWEYKGKKKVHKEYTQYVTCPKCHTSIKLNDKTEIINVGESTTKEAELNGRKD